MRRRIGAPKSSLDEISTTMVTWTFSSLVLTHVDTVRDSLR